MSTSGPNGLSRRERQIMDIIYARGNLSAAEIRDALPDPPSYSTVRALLKILETKGHVTHEMRGAQFVYAPVQPRRQAAQSALSRVVRTFYDNSVERVVTALLTDSDARLTHEELQRLAELIEAARVREEQQ